MRARSARRLSVLPARTQLSSVERSSGVKVRVVGYLLMPHHDIERVSLQLSTSPNVSQGGRGAAKSSSIRQRSELNIRKSSYGPSPAGLLAVLSPNVSIFCQGKTEHSPNRPAYPNSSGYSLPFSSAELRLATAGTPGGTARGKDSRSTATPRFYVP